MLYDIACMNPPLESQPVAALSGEVRSDSATRRRRIAHVTDFYLPRLGGIERHVADLANAQREMGDVVDVISAGGIVDSAGGRPRSMNPTGSTAGWSYGAVRAAQRAAMAGRYDVVHAHVSLATPLSFAVAAEVSRAGIPTVVTMHSMANGVAGALFGATAACVGWSDWPVEWTAVSNPAAEHLERVLGNGTTIGVLSNAIDVHRWSGCDPVEHDGIHIVAVMRLARRKRPLPLLRMLAAIRAVAPPDLRIRATIVGDGPERRSMERYLRRHRMSGWVELCGRLDRDEIRSLFSRTDIFVAPAFRESFGLAALEARAAGLPVVAMGDSGVAEFIDHGESGMLVGSDGEMAAAVVELATNLEFRSTMATSNRLTPPSFDWVNALWQADDAYERAALRQRANRSGVRAHHGAATVSA